MSAMQDYGVDAAVIPQKRAELFKLTRELALVSLISPILFMASLVCAAILLMTQVDNVSPMLFYWLVSHCLICASLFLLSLREKSVLFDPQFVPNGELPIHRFFFVSVGFLWGAVPAFIVPGTSLDSHFQIASILSGLIMSATVLLRYLPRVGCAILLAIILGFSLNTFLVPDLQSAAMTLIMMAYFSALLVCSRWYYVRFEDRLEQAESAAIRTEELNILLKEVGTSADTLLWSTDADGIILEIGTDSAAYDWADELVGQKMIDLFEPSTERDLFEARFVRRSESVGIELRQSESSQADGRWWKISAKPVYGKDAFQGFRGSATEITTLKQWEEKATFLAEYDDLTGLLKRSSFYRYLNALLDGETRNETSEVALIWIDLDHFKWINDTFGHAGGDQVLVSVSKRLKAICHPTDIICRYGGDEFAILAARNGPGMLRRFVQELTEALAEPHQLDASKAECTASIGFRLIGRTEVDAALLMKDADLALYAAKAEGRGTWREFSEAFQAEIRRHRELVEDLAEAIDRDEISLAYQPIVSPRTAEITSIEALSRWTHKTRGVIAPDEFIGVAEDNGLIIALGDCVLRKAIKTASELPAGKRLSINLSPLQLHSDNLLPLLERELTQANVPVDCIELEVTETVFMNDNDFMMHRLRKLKDLGLRIVLDDFGTGFSSLSYLQRFPFDKLKLDKAFVSEIEVNPKSRAIARAMISMAHALGLTVTAEGIETEAQAQFLRMEGCDELQGYFFDRPLSKDKLLAKFGNRGLIAPAASDHSAVATSDGAAA